MGCGAVQTMQNNKHDQLSQNALQELLPTMAIHPPLLLQQQYLQFSSSLRQNKTTYILPVEPKVSYGETVPHSILEKWRILLYGLEKSDYTYRRCLGFQVRNQNDLNRQQEKASNIANNPSYCEMKGITQYHSCFEQIEKDLNRTFSFQQHTQVAFEKVLKRIANHFPSMGYTQGVNFVVGYLLLQGYSQTDTFWIFVHLAMNKKFLLLGLYEDGFPLASIFTLLFKNILKRTDEQLFNHIYSNLLLDDSIWIFKWFITLFIYSFPLQMIKYVWDCLIELGSVGLVYFSLSLVTHLKSSILKCQDPCDISEFLQSLKTLETFNNLVEIKKVVEKAYQMKLLKEDLSGIGQCKASFYQEYYKLLQNQMQIFSNGQLKPVKAKSKENKLTMRLHLWYVKLLEERIEFGKKEETDKVLKEEIPEQLKQEYEQMQKSVKILTDKVIQNESQRSIREMPSERSHDYFNELIMEDNINTVKTQLRDEDQPSEDEVVNVNKIPTRISYNIGEQIDELEGESDSNNCEELQPSNQYLESRVHYDLSIQIDSCHPEELTPKTNKISFNNSKNIIEQQHKKKELTKANNLKIDLPQVRSGLGLAGQNILGNISITNSQYSSVQSKNTNYKPKKQKQNILSRYTSSSKAKIEALSQLSHPSNELSSDHQSSIDRRTQKDSISGFTQRDNVRQRPSFGKDETFVERKTQQEIMVISHGPQKKNTSGTHKDSISEIEIFHGQGLFKKKKRTYNRNSIITSITRQMPPGTNLFDQNKPDKVKHKTYNDEQSLESVLQLSTVRKTNRANAVNSPNILFEIESVK